MIAIAVALTLAATSDFKSTFGFELHLERAEAIAGPGGEKFVGWPEADAEAILSFFEKNLPPLMALGEECKDLELASKALIDAYKQTGAAHAEEVDALERTGKAWREAAAAATPSWIERVFTSWQLWLVVGVVVGAGLEALRHAP